MTSALLPEGAKSAPVALVTGASRGIGRAFALMAAQRGYRVVALARTTGGLEELDDAIRAASGRPATLMVVDLARTAELGKLGLGLFERFGRLDLFAGIAAYASALTPTWQLDPNDLSRALAINAQANQILLRSLHPLLAAAPGGGQVLFADGSAPEPDRPFWTSYAASKAALRVIGQTYAREMRKLPVLVRVCDPGATATALRKTFYPGEDQSAALAAGRLQRPEQAAAVLWSALEANDAPTESC